MELQPPVSAYKIDLRIEYLEIEQSERAIIVTHSVTRCFLFTIDRCKVSLRVTANYGNFRLKWRLWGPKFEQETSRTPKSSAETLVFLKEQLAVGLGGG
jgi:hypothetical protein